MAIITDIKNLSQTAALNGPDGTVDPPNTLDDQDRYLGSFIAMLRDGVGFTAGALVASLGYTPVRQGTGPNQQGNPVSIGWNATLGKILISVDANGFNNTWPIDADNAKYIYNSANPAAEKLSFAWTDPGDVPVYLWGGNSASAQQRLVPPSRLSVNYAASAGTAGACSGTAVYANNSGQISGIGPWRYTNLNFNPAYIWATNGVASDNFLVTPANLSVSYANSAGSTNTCNTASNANALGGQPPSYWINNAGSAATNLRNSGTTFLVTGISGYGDVSWNVTGSDLRLKKDIEPTQEDSLGKIARIRFVRYRFRDDVTSIPIDDGHLHPIGLIAQEAEQIDPDWISNEGSYKQPHQYALLMDAMHAVQQLADQVRVLTAKVQSMAAP